MVKLKIRNADGITLIKPSKCHRKIVLVEQGLAWRETCEGPQTRRLYPRSVEVKRGEYELERTENPFVAGGEPWLVLRGSRIGAAECWFRQLAAATRGTTNGVEVVVE